MRNDKPTSYARRQSLASIHSMYFMSAIMSWPRPIQPRAEQCYGSGYVFVTYPSTWPTPTVNENAHLYIASRCGCSAAFLQNSVAIRICIWSSLCLPMCILVYLTRRMDGDSELQQARKRERMRSRIVRDINAQNRHVIVCVNENAAFSTSVTTHSIGVQRTSSH